MLVVAMAFALAQATTAAAQPDPVAVQAAECAVHYKIREANATTEEGRSVFVRNQRFMIALMTGRDLPVAKFEEVGGAYQERFLETVQKDDAAAAEFLKSEILRCDAFVKQHAGELVRQGYGSGR